MIVRIILRYMKTIKTSLLIISLLLFTIPLFGQISGRRISVRFWYGSKYTHRVIDTCKLFITYQFKYFDDESKKGKNTDIKQLEIGNRYIRYHSYLAEKRDSLHSVTKDVNFDWRSKLGIERGYYPDLEDVYFNFHSKGNLFFTSLVLFYDYCYEETIPVIDWNIEQNKDTTIIGYHCLFATMQYGGRHYNAWFAPDIPIKYGPYKFNGLPGLIMKISDDDGLFDWVAVGITTPKRIKKMYFDQAPHIVKTDRKGYRKIYDMQWKDIGTLYRSQGSKLYVGGHGYLQPGENIDIPKIPAIENE